MVSAPRCPPGARGLLALLLLLPLPGARGECGALPRVSRAVPRDTSQTEGFSIGTEVTYRCSDDFVKIPGKSDTVVCLSNSEWSNIGEFCNGGCGALPRLKSAALSTEDAMKNYCPPGTTVSYVCRPGYESTELRHVVTCLENFTWSEAPEFCRRKSCGVPKGPEHGRAVDTTDYLYGARVNIICDDGFRLRGTPFIQCTLKGDQVEWSQLPTCEGQCGTLPMLSRAVPRDTSRTEGFPIGTEVTYRCLDGFVKIPGKSDIVVCLSNSEWSTIGEFCNGGCGAPPRLKSATLSAEDAKKNYRPPGTTLSYVCRPGYESTELRPVITCLENLTWSEAPEFCRGKSCGVPKGPEHGRAVDITNDRYGARVNIICDEGFRLRGRPFIQCMLKGDQVEWSQLPTCQAIPCHPPPDIPHGSHTAQSEQEFSFGSAVTYKCDQGFSLIGEASIHCTTKDYINGGWSGPAPECKAITCSPPPNIANGIHNGSNVEIFDCNSSVTYKCDDNFSLTGEASIHCTTKDNINGVWNGPAPECKGIECKPLELENGRVLFTDLPFGATANFSCNEGYRLIGPTSVKCVVVGNGVDWDKELPLCEEIPCRPPPDITHGSHTGQSEQEFSFGSAVTYKCDQGFSLIGEASIHCTTKDNLNGEWSGPAPECKVIITQDKTTTVPPQRNRSSWYFLRKAKHF